MQIELGFVADLSAGHCEELLACELLFEGLDINEEAGPEGSLDLSGVWKLHPHHLEALAVEVADLREVDLWSGSHHGLTEADEAFEAVCGLTNLLLLRLGSWLGGENVEERVEAV